MENTMRGMHDLACAMGYEIALQRVLPGEALSLPVWEIHGKDIRQTEGGLALEQGLYLVQLSCEAENAGLVLSLNGTKLRYLETGPTEGECRLNLQGLLHLTAPAVLRAENNGQEAARYRRAVMTLLRL